MKAKFLLSIIPTSIRITKDIRYEIVWVDEFLNDKKQLGECRYEFKQILINKQQSPTEAYKTFLHELLHAIQFEYPELKLTHSQIYKLEEIIFRLLRLNNLFDFLNKK
jgi:hypothetical protein